MNINASISYANQGGFPAGTVIASIAAALVATQSANNQSASLTPGQTSLSFANVAADTYYVSLTAKDSAGNTVYGPVNSGNLTVTEPASTITLSVPSNITLSQA